MDFEIEGLEEAFSSVTDKLKRVINKCVHTLEVNGFKLPIKESPALRFKLGDKSSALGTAYYPKSTHNGNYLVVLSKYLEDMPEDEIQNTIYHELGHILCYIDEFKKGYIYLDSNGDTKLSGEDNYEKRLNKKKLAGHGPEWQRIMKRISAITGQSYQRLADAESSDNFRKASASKYKYFFKCPNCGSKLQYTRATDFTKTFDKKDANGQPCWWCTRCRKTTGKKIAFVKDERGGE